MDRQYNAVNFQYFAQAAEAGVTKAGAEASFKRRLCTSRLSFYIEAGPRGGKVVQKTWQGLGKNVGDGSCRMRISWDLELI